MEEITGYIEVPFHGESAYEIARRHGFSGSEDEWLEQLGRHEAARIIKNMTDKLYGYTWEAKKDIVKDSEKNDIGTLLSCMTDEFKGTWFLVESGGEYPEDYRIIGAGKAVDSGNYVLWTGSDLVYAGSLPDKSVGAEKLSGAREGMVVKGSTDGAVWGKVEDGDIKPSEKDGQVLMSYEGKAIWKDLTPCDELKRYGVRFEGGLNSGSSVKRLYDAEGLVAEVGTDTQTAENDFDSIYPWAGRRRCCGYFNEEGNFVINAYEGEPGYISDGSNGDIWVETPLFYYEHKYEGDSEEIVISPYPIAGYKPSPMHVNSDGTVRNKAYTAAYQMSVVDGRAVSRSGVEVNMNSMNENIEAARMLGSGYTVMRTQEHYTECLLMWVEFATRNMQNVMSGASRMRYVVSDTAVMSEKNTNRIIVPASVAGQYVTGQSIVVGEKGFGTDITVKDRRVVEIKKYDDENSAIVFDGEAVDIEKGNALSSYPWITGICDNVKASSGSFVSNSDSKHPCVYRGVENPYGNVTVVLSDLLLKRTGEGTEENPYRVDVYYLPEADKYDMGKITDDYVKLYQLSQQNGYVKLLGYDERYPHVRLPVDSDGSSTTYYSDRYRAGYDYEVMAVYAGGGFSMIRDGGLNAYDCHLTSASRGLTRNARLAYVQK